MFDIKYNKETFNNKNVIDNTHQLGDFIIHQSLLDDLALPKVMEDPIRYMFDWDHDMKTLNGNVFPDLVS